MVKEVKIIDFNTFDQVLSQHMGDKVYVWLTSSVDPETGVAWCPDCVEADPLVREMVDKVQGATFLECIVGDRHTYREEPGPKHPYRTNPKIMLTALPTLIEFSKGEPVRKLIEIECYDDKKLKQFFNL